MIEHYLQKMKQLCPAFSQSDVDFIQSRLSVRELPPKAVFLQAGEVPKYMGMVGSGLLKTFYLTEGGEQININFCQEGQVVGDYLAFMHQTPSKYSFQALEYSRLIEFPYAHWQTCLQEIPAFERYVRLMLEAVFAAYLARTEEFLMGLY
ncbi:Crp/Fnr family transcriptional regulator [Neisseria perflava]|uniref:Crp/Fnr family transcriptional regulator n=1 Tax=Neisseria perflava TaxID=33053 RepID=UPI00209F2F9A|nr:Crp/Fnr family transcriptional regulator [Neisseria perflava]MCP1661332.1 CRP-like cAMP-binding protein [Neisseria perflava]